jgi:hypothetical protein
VKTACNIALGVLGFGAWVVIGSAGDSIRERGDALTSADIFYLLLLIMAVVYFHWLFRVFVMPLSGLPQSKRVALNDRVNKKYWAGFFRGTVGCGYFLLFLYVFAYLLETPKHSEVPNFALGAIFFIGLGVLAQARGLVLALTSPELNMGQEAGIKPGAPPNGGPAASVDNSNAPGGPPSVS